MKRSISFTVVAIAVHMSAPAIPAQDTARVVATQVAPGIHMLANMAGGNMGLSAGADGVFIIDDQVAPLTARVLEAIRGVTDKSVDFVLNTHFHYDHTGGNEAIGGSGALIVAHDNVRRRLSADHLFETFNFTQKATAKAGLPVVTFSRDVTFHLNGDELYAFHVRNAHTDGDAVVYFRNANVIHTGDLFFNGIYPFIDLSSGGSMDGMIAGANRLVALSTAGTKIIPGHGPLADRAALVRYRDMLVGVRASVAAAMRGNRSLGRVKAAKPTARWDAAWGRGFLTPDQFVEIVYNSLRRR